MNTTDNKHQNLKSELFRFVNVRPPGPGAPKDDPAYIRYDRSRFKLTEGRLFTDLCQLVSMDPNEARYKLADILKSYPTTENYLAADADVHAAYPGYHDFYAWTRSVKTETASTVSSRLQTYTNRSAADIANDVEGHSRLWDNYFFYLVQGTNMAMVQLLTEMLRVQAIAGVLNGTDDESINSLEAATIILPDCISGVLTLSNYQPQPDKSPAPPQGMETPEGPSVLSRTLENTSSTVSVDQLYTILDQLKNRVDTAANPALNDEDMAVALSGEIPLTGKQWNMLQPDIRTVLEAGGFQAEQGTLIDMIAYLDAEISKRYAEVFAALSFRKKYFMVGSSFVEASALSGQSTSTKKLQKVQESLPDGSFDFSSLYGGFWGTHADPDALLDIQVGDFMRVEHEVEQYVPGEVAHIENILQGEAKERNTRRLLRTEETAYYEEETTEEEERDVQTTDRFEMERETEQVIKTDTQVDAGVDVSGTYGVVTVNANAGFYGQVTTDNSTRQAIEYAKSVTEKARQKVIKTTKTSRTSTIIREFEDKNLHKIDNVGGDGNVVGIYRWVDKIYKASLLNYGKRMMIKFHLIEPSRYYKFTQSANAAGEVVMPLSPEEVAQQAASDADPQNDSMTVLRSFRDLNRHNYALWAQAYGANVATPPKEQVWIGTTINDTARSGSQGDGSGGATNTSFRIVTGEKTNLVVPEKYKATMAYIRADFSLEGPTKDHGVYAGDPNATVFVGNSKVHFESGHRQLPSGTTQNRGQLETRMVRFQSDQDRYLPVTYKVDRSDVFYANILVACELTEKAYQDWQKETYEAIMTAYRQKLEEAEYKKSQLMAVAGVQIKGRNPRANKQIIATELKRQCIENIRLYTTPLLAHRLSDIPSYIQQGAGGEPVVDYGDYYHYLQQGKYANAIEEYFDWDNITYRLHDYFWGDHDKWVSMINQQDTDPLFENFLKAGSSTVIVPVKPGYERLFAYHLRTTKIWRGGDVPLPAEVEQYIAAEFDHLDPDAEPDCKECWNYQLPTDLVILQKQDGGLDETGLPSFDLPDNCG